MKTILNLLSQARLAIIDFYVRNREYMPMLIAFGVFVIYAPISRIMDKGAAPIDLGAISAIILSPLVVFVAKRVVWYLLRTIWPDLYNYFITDFSNDFKTLTPWQKIKICLASYGFLLLCIVVAFKSAL